MITIDYISDIHMEINYGVEHCVKPVDDTGDILILNGDINCFRFFHKWRTDKEADVMKKRITNFINNQPHEHIIWIPGNHEYYGTHYFDAVPWMKTITNSINPRLQVLNNEVFSYKDIDIFCGTFWTDFNRYDPLAMLSVKDFMRDYQVIWRDENKQPITPDDTYNEHRKFMELLKNTYENRGDQKFLVASHHGPSLMSHSSARFGDTLIKYGYLSEYGDWIANTDILAWIHGHTHHNVEYRIGDTLISSAMYGYLGHDRLPSESKMNFGRIYA